METMRIAIEIAVAAAVIGAMTVSNPPVRAEDFPNRPVTIVVPFTPGGAGDILSRLIGPRLDQKWGKPVVVENKPGAGGIVGALAVQKAPPDGHTLMIAPSATLAINVSLYKSLPYDPATDFVPLALAAQTAFVLVVNPSLPVTTLAEFIAYARARPGQLSYASSGAGVPHHLFAELLSSMTGLKMTHVPYKGSVPALNDVVAGHVPLMFVDLGPALGIVRAGKVRALGVSTAARVPLLPEVPPIGETVPGFAAASWQMAVAPAKTPKPVVDKLNAHLAGVFALPEVRDQIAQAGMTPVESGSVESLRAFIRSEIARWGKVVEQAGIAGSM
jgi:tripartite-type tricarboxylate transporter receptor subunit TctC